MNPTQINIIYLLLNHLNRELWFEIPGIGIFTGTKSSSYLNHIEQKIYPGTISMEYLNANTFRAEKMLSNLAEETGYKQEDLEEHLAALCQTISEALRSNNFFEFAPFGILQRDNDRIVFKQSSKNIHQEFYHMNALSITPLTNHPEIASLPFTGVPAQVKKPKRELKFLLLALGILWIIFLGLLLCPPSSRYHNKENIKKAQDSNSIKSTQDSINIPKLIPVSTDSGKIQIKDSVISNIDTDKQFSHEVQVDSSNVDHLNNTIKNKPCVIIIGSFLKISNADRLSKTADNDGYQVYRGEYGKFHRVGIQFNCFQKDLNEMLSSLKKKYHPDAWVLKF